MTRKQSPSTRANCGTPLARHRPGQNLWRFQLGASSGCSGLPVSGIHPGDDDPDADSPAPGSINGLS